MISFDLHLQHLCESLVEILVDSMLENEIPCQIFRSITFIHNDSFDFISCKININEEQWVSWVLFAFRIVHPFIVLLVFIFMLMFTLILWHFMILFWSVKISKLRNSSFHVAMFIMSLFIVIFFVSMLIIISFRVVVVRSIMLQLLRLLLMSWVTRHLRVHFLFLLLILLLMMQSRVNSSISSSKWSFQLRVVLMHLCLWILRMC